MNLFLVSIIAIFCTLSVELLEEKHNNVSRVGTIKYRLARNVRPSFYALKLHPDLDKETFNGSASIYVEVEDFVESIALHSSELNITSFYLNSEKLAYFPDLDNEIDSHAYLFSDHQLLEVIRVDRRPIAPGDYILHLEWNGKFSQDRTGFYKATFTQELSESTVTEFVPTHARRVFPCFDEPFFKAKFQVTLVAPNDSYTALSNMPVIKKFHTSLGNVYRFETTKVMSTYLLAFMVTRYTYGEFMGHGGVPIRAYSKNITNEQCQHILESADKSLQFYANYTGYPYPLPKLDLIEYDRRETSAAEYWGLIAVASGLLSSRYATNKRIGVIAHEIAHSWFGNLVTNKWWDDIWLHEGLTVYMALKAKDYIINNNASNRFSKDYIEDIIYWGDKRKPSESVVNPAKTPNEIRNNFNTMTYIKGAAVFQMIEQVLGETHFRNAIKRYVGKYAFKTVTTRDLTEIFENFAPSKVDFRGFVTSYLHQDRYPLFEVTENEYNYLLKQISWDYEMNNPETPLGFRWTVPITYTNSLTKDQNNQLIAWFDRDMEVLEIAKGNESWILFNQDRKGLYRVSYSEDLWNKFIDFGHDMDVEDRDNLFLEAINLYWDDIISCDVALRYVKGLAKRNVIEPVKSDSLRIAIDGMENLKVGDPKAYGMVENFLESLMITKIYVDVEELTFPTKNLEKCGRWIRKNLKK